MRELDLAITNSCDLRINYDNSTTIIPYCYDHYCCDILYRLLAPHQKIIVQATAHISDNARNLEGGNEIDIPLLGTNAPNSIA